LTSLVNPRNWFAEAIGTYALVFFGPLAIILSVVAFGDGLSIESIIMIALAHGAAVGLWYMHLVIYLEHTSIQL